MQAARLVLKQGWAARAVARHTGFNQGTIVRWVKEARMSNHQVIQTNLHVLTIAQKRCLFQQNRESLHLD